MHRGGVFSYRVFWSHYGTILLCARILLHEVALNSEQRVEKIKRKRVIRHIAISIAAGAYNGIHS